jgi:hypothetical protein
MNQEFEQKLMNEFPWMEDRSWRTGEKLGKPISIECGDGWSQLIYDLCKELQITYEKMSKEDQDNFYATQIKEKLAGLRFYISIYNDEISNAIDKAERKSHHTCEKCGAEGKLRNDGWLVILCDNCHKK